MVERAQKVTMREPGASSDVRLAILVDVQGPRSQAYGRVSCDSRRGLCDEFGGVARLLSSVVLSGHGQESCQDSGNETDGSRVERPVRAID